MVETYLPHHSSSAKAKAAVPAIPLVSLPSLLPGLPNQPLLVTPYHPLRAPGSLDWSFPVDLARDSVPLTANSVFSFLLDREHVMMINGYECARFRFASLLF